MVTSIMQGNVTAFLMFRKPGSYPRQNGLALALRELGRIERIDSDLLKYLSPLGWEHINLTGDNVWRQILRLIVGQFRQLRILKKP
jgi:TnpA family transposase